MTVQGGYGLPFTLNGTAVVHVLNLSFPEFRKFMAESTGHDSTGGYYEATATGKRRIMPFPVTLGWDTSEATHAAVVTAFDADTAAQWTVADPDGNETVEFNAHVENIRRLAGDAATDNLYRAECDLHPTGTATIT